MEKTRTQAVCVDLLKLIFAYCVVAIHTQAANKAPLYLQFWTALAVPFFFVCSGYYFQIKLNAVGHESVGGGKRVTSNDYFVPLSFGAAGICCWKQRIDCLLITRVFRLYFFSWGNGC